MYEPGQHRQFTCKIIQNHIKVFDAASRVEDNGTTTATTAASSNGNNGSNGTAGGGIINGASPHYNGGGSGSYSKNGTVAMHNYYVKNGHHCCT
ncbi:uncharacterized protein LOC111593641 isoform X2 [Drosophila hydei]|uniref:Uncharacterized protein LOC111593641 isoform X2 n=1 Tax=Drosophila hydei TaxID=7224 RepID=A0A6J1L8T8_DROHY|nr:uncharacterized protein LOC111593641 isoform X2 [Drosophila hydei]